MYFFTFRWLLLEFRGGYLLVNRRISLCFCISFQNLRAEARIRLTQLDGLTQRSRTLVGLFRGAMGTRLIEMMRDCGQRWDQLSNTVETVCRRLKVYKDPQAAQRCHLLNFGAVVKKRFTLFFYLFNFIGMVLYFFFATCY